VVGPKVGVVVLEVVLVRLRTALLVGRAAVRGAGVFQIALIRDDPAPLALPVDEEDRPDAERRDAADGEPEAGPLLPRPTRGRRGHRAACASGRAGALVVEHVHSELDGRVIAGLD